MKKKKNSAMKKLIPATSMLLVSATMLTASTYAWFTMSKEVEVTGIKLVATVPEDLQISLGLNTNNKLDVNGLRGTAAGGNIAVKYDEITAPDETTNTTDWFNTVDFSEHYIAGRLKPASSTDGRYLFKTADANEQGKAVSKVANFGLVADKTDAVGLYRLGSESNNEFSGVAVAPNNLASGYYVDFPVWFRTSSKEANGTAANDTDTVTAKTAGSVGNKTLELGVIATIKQSTASDATEDLYHAVRVAVIPANASGALQLAEGTKGVINDTTAAYYERYSATNAEAGVTNKNLAQALKASGNLVYSPVAGKNTNVLDHYGRADTIVQANTVDPDTSYFTVGEPVVSVPLAQGDAKYGTATKYVIRVWLEGEDVNCWNETAGQDFDVSLRFVMLKSNSTFTDDSDIDESTATAASTDTKLTNVSITVNNHSGSQIGTIAYSRASTSDAFSVPTVTNAESTPAVDPNLLAGTDTHTYALGDGTTFGNISDLTAYLNEHDGFYSYQGLVLTATT